MTNTNDVMQVFQPLEVGTLVIDPNGECENDGRIFSGGDVEIYPTEGAGPVAIVAGLEWAGVFQDAPAAKLALELICAGVATIGIGEFAGTPFFFMLKDDRELPDSFEIAGKSWTQVINAIGWPRCLQALAAARGGE